MSITLTGNGFTYTLPATLDVRSVRQETRLEGAVVQGRRGKVFRPFGIADDVQELLIEGYLSAASGAALNTLLDDLMRTLNSGILTLKDSYTLRMCRIRKGSFGYLRDGRSLGAWTYQVSARLVVMDGVWLDDANTAPHDAEVTLTLIGTTPVVRTMALNVGGSGTTHPTVRAVLASGVTWTPEITWRGANMISNPSFESGVDTPDDWTGTGSPTAHQHGGRTGARLIEVNPTGYFYQDVPINGNTQYTISGYFRAETASLYGTVYISWRDSAGGEISNTGGTGTALLTGSAWQRLSLTQTAPNNAVAARVSGNGTAGAYLDDMQFEATAAATAFADDAHITLARDVNLVYASAHRTWTVDMARGRARLLSSSGIWADDLANINGHFWGLSPVNSQRQHVTYTSPTGGTVVIKVFWQNRYV